MARSVCTVAIAMEFEGPRFDEGFRADLIIEGMVIAEPKSVEKDHPGHRR